MKQRRKISASQSLTQVPPTSSEAEHLHSFYLQYGQHTSGKTSGMLVQPTTVDDSRERVWMGDTTLSKTLLMFPQERNVHQKVFGGYLMRLAYEVRLLFRPFLYLSMSLGLTESNLEY